MEVFISWSGDRSKKVAEALRDWLPNVIQSVDPFMSASDIDKGSRWLDDLATHLEAAQFGLICLTQENLEAPWLLFEAGALSKSIKSSRVVPYLHEVSQAQLQGPLAQFQAAVADRSSTLGVIESINGALEGDGLEQARLETAFETWWPRLKEGLDNIPEATEEAPPSRTERDILEEVLSLSRQILRQGVPDEFDQETLRNRMVHGLPLEHLDSTEDLGPEDLQLSTYDSFRRMEQLRRLQERESRERRVREIQERESRERRVREIQEHQERERRVREIQEQQERRMREQQERERQ